MKVIKQYGKNREQFNCFIRQTIAGNNYQKKLNTIAHVLIRAKTPNQETSELMKSISIGMI